MAILRKIALCLFILSNAYIFSKFVDPLQSNGFWIVAAAVTVIINIAVAFGDTIAKNGKRNIRVVSTIGNFLFFLMGVGYLQNPSVYAREDYFLIAGSILNILIALGFEVRPEPMEDEDSLKNEDTLQSEMQRYQEIERGSVYIPPKDDRRINPLLRRLTYPLMGIAVYSMTFPIYERVGVLVFSVLMLVIAESVYKRFKSKRNRS